MRLLITGGFGYLGGRLAQYLVTKPNYEIILGSRKKVESPDWLPDAKVAHTLWGTASSLENVCSGVDAVIHLAAVNSGDSFDNPVEALEVNALGTARLLQAAVNKGVKRFLYLSTAHVYGNLLKGKVTEDTCPVCTHPYATSHFAGEKVVLDYHQRGKIEGVVVRLSNSFGAPAHRHVNCWMLLVNDLCCQAINTNRMVLKSSGTERRNFISLTDACRAIVHLLELPAYDLGDSLFNLGSFWSPTILEMAQRVASRVKLVTGENAEILVGERIDGERSNPIEYGIKKLTDTGFSLSRDEVFDKELDGLIKFCLTHKNNLK